jgi:hypothetical protein
MLSKWEQEERKKFSWLHSRLQFIACHYTDSRKVLYIKYTSDNDEYPTLQAVGIFNQLLAEILEIYAMRVLQVSINLNTTLVDTLGNVIVLIICSDFSP